MQMYLQITYVANIHACVHACMTMQRFIYNVQLLLRRVCDNCFENPWI